jgi:hypothetical protein
VTPKKRAKPLTHIKDLVPDPKNRRKHTPRNVGMIVDALNKVGAGRSIVIDENNEVLAGNATIDAAGEAGITKLKVIDTDGSEVVAVRRTGLTADQKRDLAIYDNRTGELAEWDVEQLMKDVDSGVDLSPMFFDEELSTLMANAIPTEDLSMPAPDGEMEDNTPPEMLSASNIAMVQLFLTVDTIKLFKEAVKALSVSYGTTTVTDTVFHAVTEAYGKIEKV